MKTIITLTLLFATTLFAQESPSERWARAHPAEAAQAYSDWLENAKPVDAMHLKKGIRDEKRQRIFR